MKNFRTLGAEPPDPRASGGWGLCPQTPILAPPLQISGYAPAYNWLISWQNQNLQGKSWSELLFTKILQEAMRLTSSYMDQTT